MRLGNHCEDSAFHSGVDVLEVWDSKQKLSALFMVNLTVELRKESGGVVRRALNQAEAN